MSAIVELYSNQFFVFVLVLTRIGAMMGTAPVFSGGYIPMRIRVLLAVGMTILVAPLQWGTPIERPDTVINFLTLVGGEAIVGLSLGLGIAILFSGLQIAGQVIGQMSGMHLADIFDPAFEATVPLFAQLINLVALAIYLIVGGHRMALDALMDTFQWIPPGSGTLSGGIVEVLTDVLLQSFILGIRAVAPAMIALLMSVLTLGLISRTLPQLNVLAVGFSLNSMIMLGVLSLSLGTLVWVFQDQVEPTIDAFREMFRESGGMQARLFAIPDTGSRIVPCAPLGPFGISPYPTV